MPIYEYRCRECGEIFESFRAINASDEEVVCPRCGAKKPNRRLSSVYGKLTDGKGNLRFPT